MSAHSTEAQPAPSFSCAIALLRFIEEGRLGGGREMKSNPPVSIGLALRGNGRHLSLCRRRSSKHSWCHLPSNPSETEMDPSELERAVFWGGDAAPPRQRSSCHAGHDDTKRSSTAGSCRGSRLAVGGPCSEPQFCGADGVSFRPGTMVMH